MSDEKITHDDEWEELDQYHHEFISVTTQGFRHNRTKSNPREALFAEHWDAANNARFSSTPLIYHLIPDCTERDEKVAATIIQWLGTNVGWSFLMEALKSLEGGLQIQGRESASWISLGKRNQMANDVDRAISALQKIKEAIS